MKHFSFSSLLKQVSRHCTVNCVSSVRTAHKTLTSTAKLTSVARLHKQNIQLGSLTAICTH